MAATITEKFEKKAQNATMEVVQTLLSKTASLTEQRQAVKRWEQLKKFNHKLLNLKSGALDPRTLAIVVINGRSFYQLREKPWIGYFTYIGAAQVLTGVNFIDEENP